MRSPSCTGAMATMVLMTVLATAAAGGALERQLAFDDAGRILKVGREARAAFAPLGWDRDDFRAATLWQQSADSSVVLEGEFASRGAISRERIALDAAQLAKVRADVVRVRRAGAEATPPLEGRTLLGLGTFTIGASFYSWAVPDVFDLEGGHATSAGVLSVSGSLLVPWIATDRTAVSFGDANLALIGGTRGIAYGVLVHDLFDPSESDSGDDDSRLTAAFIGSLTGEVGGFAWAHAARLSPGEARAIGLGSDFGMLWGIGVATIAHDAGAGDSKRRVQAIGGVVGGGAGVGVGRWIGGRHDYTWGDVGAVRMAGIIGALVGITPFDLDDNDHDDATIGCAIGASALGLFVGDRLLGERDFSVGQGLMLEFMSIAGGLTGLAIVELGNSENSQAFTAAAAAGAAAGWALGLRTVPSLSTARFDLSRSGFQLDASGLMGALVTGRQTSGPWIRLGRRF